MNLSKIDQERKSYRNQKWKRYIIIYPTESKDKYKYIKHMPTFNNLDEIKS